MEDIRQTKGWGEYLESCGWVVDRVKDIYVFIKKIPLTPFSMMKIQRFHGKLDLNSLRKIKKKYKVIYTVVEPGVPLGSDPPSAQWLRGPAPTLRSRAPARVRPSLRVNKKPFLPTKTIIIDLKKSEKQLWNDLATNAKRILKKKDYTSEQIIFKKNDSSDEKSKENRARFYEAWKGSSKTWLMGEERFIKLLDAFGKKASLWISESGDKLLSGIILLESSDTANYFQTWTSKEGRKLGAHYHLVWRVILECKKRGLKWFDFEGIFDERWPIKKWAGFSEFKKKFGGRVVTYPGSFMRWF